MNDNIMIVKCHNRCINNRRRRRSRAPNKNNVRNHNIDIKMSAAQDAKSMLPAISDSKLTENHNQDTKQISLLEESIANFEMRLTTNEA